MRKDAVLRALIEKEFLKKTYNFLKQRIEKIPVNIVVWFARQFTPIDKNQVMFVTTRGDYDCNAKWIAEQLRRTLPSATIVWTIRGEEKNDIPKKFIQVRRGSYDFYKQISRAKVIIDNSVSVAYLNYRKKKNQILIETWHGSIGIKMFSRETNKDKEWCRKADFEGNMTDYCISNSTFEDKIYKDTFWSNARILQLGHARNDVLCWNDSERLDPIRKKVFQYFKLSDVVNELKQQCHQDLTCWYQEIKGIIPPISGHLGKKNPFEKMNIDDSESFELFLKKEYSKCENLKICLYAPTFRDDGDMSPYEIDYERLRQALHTRFGGTWVIMTRFHFRLRKQLKKYELPIGVIDASSYSDIQELLVCTDVGITDYSSWICDYMLTGRPGFLFATDMLQYEKKEREFFYPLSTMPFPLALTNEQLIENILNFKSEGFTEKCRTFLKEKGCIDDGHSAERVADAISAILKGETV